MLPVTILRTGEHAPGKPRRRGQVELNHILVPGRTGRKTPRHPDEGRRNGGAQGEGGRETVADGALACGRAPVQTRMPLSIPACACRMGHSSLGNSCPRDSVARRAALPAGFAPTSRAGAWPPQRYNAWLSSCGGEEAAAARARRGRRLAGPPLTKELVTGSQDRASRNIMPGCEGNVIFLFEFVQRLGSPLNKPRCHAMAGLAAAESAVAKLLKAVSDRAHRLAPHADELRQLCEATLASVAQAKAAAAPDGEEAATAMASAVFLPFVVALETKNLVLVEEALDGLNEVIAYGLLRDCPDPRDASSKLVDVLVAAVCGCGCLQDEKVGACMQARLRLRASRTARAPRSARR